MLNIKGKSYTYCNWAICAYHFIQNTSSYVDTILPNESLIIKIMNDAKELRKYDFLKNAALQYSDVLRHKMRNLNKISYIPTISYKYILEFANLDSMQCDLDIIEYIINEIMASDAADDTGSISTYIISTNVGESTAATDIISHINAVEQKQYELIQLFLLC